MHRRVPPTRNTEQIANDFGCFTRCSIFYGDSTQTFCAVALFDDEISEHLNVLKVFGQVISTIAAVDNRYHLNTSSPSIASYGINAAVICEEDGTFAWFRRIAINVGLDC